MKSRHYRQSL
jgi:uncharacterized protein with HEPN domain